MLHERAWRDVPNRALTKTDDNIAGSALLWVGRGQIQCFRPDIL